MGLPRKNPYEKVYGVAGCVDWRVKRLLQEESKRKEVSIGRLIGGILTEWAGDRQPYVPDSENQMELFAENELLESD